MSNNYCSWLLSCSQIAACTGQPILADNVTQAQAFCIATACLQVSVSEKTNPLMTKTSHFIERTANKLNLLKSFLLFGPSRAFTQKRAFPPPFAQHRFRRELENAPRSNSLIKIRDLIGNLNFSLESDRLSSTGRLDSSKASTQNNSPSYMVAKVATTLVPPTKPLLEPATIEKVEKKPKPVFDQYPNFNQKYAQIQAGSLPHSVASHWQPGSYSYAIPSLLFNNHRHDHDNHPGLALHHQVNPLSRIAGFIVETHRRLAWKRYRLANSLINWSNSNKPAQLYAAKGVQHPYPHHHLWGSSSHEIHWPLWTAPQ